MTRAGKFAVCLAGLALSAPAQESAKPTMPGQAAKGTTVIGCLSGPDADNQYTLTSMEHRLGVAVAGGDELQKGAGAKVKLTGAWEPLPGSPKSTNDAMRRFQATGMVVMEEKCTPPSSATPVSKKKPQQQQPPQKK